MSPHDDNGYLKACRTSGIIIDTNLLIVLLVGSYNQSLIHYCCSGFDRDTFAYMMRLLAHTNARIIVTPHMLTEVSNLTFRNSHIRPPGLATYIEKLIETIKEAHEEPVEKKVLLVDPKMLARFGFTDLSIIEAAIRLKCAVMTSDSKLVESLMTANCPARNILSIMPLVPAPAA